MVAGAFGSLGVMGLASVFFGALVAEFVPIQFREVLPAGYAFPAFGIFVIARRDCLWLSHGPDPWVRGLRGLLAIHQGSRHDDTLGNQ